MKLTSFVTAIFFFISSLMCTSCSGTSEVTTRNEVEKKSSVYPGWYNPDQTFIPDTTKYRGYATALASDSSAAVGKAFTHAEEELKSGISGRLESIRIKAADELGNSSGLNTPGFIITLRKAETNIFNATKRVNVNVESNEPYSGYRGFAEAAVAKKAVIRELDTAMARYKTAWNAMKTSQAFSEF